MIIGKGISFGTGIQLGESAVVTPTYSVSLSKNTMTENNDSVVVTVTTANVLDSTWIYWQIDGSFLQSQIAVTTGYAIVKNKTASFTIKSLPNGLINGVTSFFVKIRTGSIAGPVVVTSPAVTILDTSTAP